MFSPRTALTALIVGLAALAGCAAQTGEELGSGTEALTTLPSVQLLGNIANGETKAGNLSGGATHRAYAFRPTGNDKITVDVGFAGGKAVAFLTDLNFGVITQSENTTGDARVTLTVPPGPHRSMRVVFKEKNATPGNFSVKLGVQAGACDASGSEASFHTYQSTDVAECAGLFIDCSAGEEIFKNSCGCGCERANP